MGGLVLPGLISTGTYLRDGEFMGSGSGRAVILLMALAWRALRRRKE
jgi:hypothetical protein